ncbi:MAG: hypothetical protein HN580_27260 [Deltaproteobacteria bacterium]|jgi:hypothetical protein|nr:hypothetical protein [Deltaproteobacteria bacterium]MBT4086907.1 hypothetical protein [Deltaproteobacteria bacterium]MBT4269122.1 hypothetical protein [Deltaproteobacteria bacterium]MBT4641297.1 hypothetical protein [Deltaproteobacteria bacterium]MBT6504267.1 hypothetical protein [Deltaproteobacteria bacterium]
MDISQRLFRLMRTIAEDKFETIGRFIDEGSDYLDERLKTWETEFDFRDEEPDAETRQQKQHTQSQSSESIYSSQLIEDLQLFGLIPPSSLEEVRQIRNQEMKKFHPDRYLNQPEKMETAKQIVQIYNAAYDRLKKNFNSV